MLVNILAIELSDDTLLQFFVVFVQWIVSASNDR